MAKTPNEPIQSMIHCCKKSLPLIKYMQDMEQVMKNHIGNTNIGYTADNSGKKGTTMEASRQKTGKFHCRHPA